VRLVQVQERQMAHTIHTVGTVAVDENRVYSVNPRFSGWVEQLAVRAVGDDDATRPSACRDLFSGII
ncbi:efflux RND transporter periplasmic adaptor subunit, partial [Acidithiobacillus thiooxidans]|uniref:efflux RND transporter periplasmic adaptor subunit n=1 Tax=Acidithiobacillus thiooxidans TaxID=930 RepID=UPI003B505469